MNKEPEPLEALGPSDELIEKLATLEHEQWAHWTRHMLDVLDPLLEVGHNKLIVQAGRG